MVQTHEGAGLTHFYGSILHALRAPIGNGRDVGRKAEQLDHLLHSLRPRVLIFDEFHNALRGRTRDAEAVFAFLRRIGRQYDISPVLIGEVAVFDFINATSEMASRFDLHAVPRWQYGEEFLTLLDSLEGAMPLARGSDLSDEPLARTIFQLSEGLIGEIIAIVTAATITAARSGKDHEGSNRRPGLEASPGTAPRRPAMSSGQRAGSGVAIEVRERYRDVVRDRWPMAIDPQPDELLSSWLHRLAIANGVAPRWFAGVLGLGEGMWSARLDHRLPHGVATVLQQQADVATETLSAMTMEGRVLTPLLLPLREKAGRNRSTWMQYCPLCFAGDDAPYFRCDWRLATRISCFVHGCGLRDRCPACRSGIASFDQTELMPQHFCARCASSGKPKPRSHGPNRVSPSASIWVRSQVADPEQFCHWDMVGGISNGVLYIVSRCHVSLPSPPVSPARADLPR